jgi:hypothetical protein
MVNNGVRFGSETASPPANPIRVALQLITLARSDGLTNLPPGKVDAKADAAPVGATNREMRRPSLDTLEGFFYV